MKISTSDSAPNLRGANLNLVPILRALLREVSVTVAARQVGLSPSAVSCALAELRLLFDDPLLVRVGQRMARTRRAEQLLDRIEQACAALEALLREEIFDPATLNRHFVVAAPDHLALLLGAALAKRLGLVAPGIGVHFIDIGEGIDRAMVTGAVDMCLADRNTFVWDGATLTPGCRDRLVGIAATGHRIFDRRLSKMADLADFPAIAWDPGPGLTSRTTPLLLQLLDMVDARIKLPSLNALPLMVVESDLIAIVPATLAWRMMRYFPLSTFDLPGESIWIDTALHWGKSLDTDEAHRWFRAIVAEEVLRCHEGATPFNAS